MALPDLPSLPRPWIWLTKSNVPPVVSAAEEYALSRYFAFHYAVAFDQSERRGVLMQTARTRSEYPDVRPCAIVFTDGVLEEIDLDNADFPPRTRLMLAYYAEVVRYYTGPL